VLKFQGTQQIPIVQRGRTRGKQPLKTPRSSGERYLILNRVDVSDVDGADRGEVPFGRIVRAFGVVNIGCKFRNQEVQIRVALAMRMRGLVYRNLVNKRGEIGAVVQVVAAQQKLVGFPLSAVYGDDEARNGLEQLAGTKGGHERQLVIDHDALARCRGEPSQP